MAEDIPQWKKDLIARLRNQNKLWTKNFVNYTPHQHATAPTTSSSSPANHRVQQPNNNNNTTNGIPSNHTPSVAGVGSSAALLPAPTAIQPAGNSYAPKMVQERVWLENTVNSEPINGKDDSDEDLRYGPGIVSKLKNKYLSLALRENNARQRPSILAMRKAASLENLLDENDDALQNGEEEKSKYQKNSQKTPIQMKQPRYNRTAQRTMPELKRARSVETISRDTNEEALIRPEDGPKSRKFQHQISVPAENNKYTRINRPKRIAPIMNEREKPPTDVVKHAKLIFERRAEQRTRAPLATGEVAAKIDSYNNIIVKSKAKTKPPIAKTKPGVKPPKSLDLVGKNVKISTPLTSPIPDVSRIGKEENCSVSSLCETPDLILTSSPVANPPSILSPTFRKTSTETFLNEERFHAKAPSPIEPEDLIKDEKPPKLMNRNVSTVKTPPSQQLKIDTTAEKCVPDGKSLTETEIEKNRINNVKSQQNGETREREKEGSSDVKKYLVPKKPKTTYIEPTTAVFNFTSRKDVPDYIANDTSRSATKPTLPKPGEGGVIIISGASVSESFTDEDEEIMRSLECPPSPCDVTFINDNILIEGKSSLRQKTKKAKMKISFIEAGPEVFEYPSETSLLTDDTIGASSNQSSHVGHTVPNLSGSTLANYTPKSTAEDFLPGITQRTTPALQNSEINAEDVVLEEYEEPILFSAGTNSDILF